MARHRRAERRPAPPPVGAALPRRAQHSRRTRLGAGFRQRPARQPGQFAAQKIPTCCCRASTSSVCSRTGQPIGWQTTARRCASGTRVGSLSETAPGIVDRWRKLRRGIIATAPQHAGKLWPALDCNFDFEPIATVYLQFEAKTRLAFRSSKAIGKIRSMGGRPRRRPARLRPQRPRRLGGPERQRTRRQHSGGTARPARRPGKKSSAKSAPPSPAAPASPARISSTSDPRVMLAGDYTWADYPATLEGAVRSGKRAAHVLRSTSNSEQKLADTI